MSGLFTAGLTRGVMRVALTATLGLGFTAPVHAAPVLAAGDRPSLTSAAIEAPLLAQCYESRRDIDGDCIRNGRDRDVDGDGIRNRRDRDVDGDGISNRRDR